MSEMADNLQAEEPAAETEWLVFRRSRIHGLGGFARKDIPRNTRVIEYVGEKIDKQESLRRCEANNEYVFTLNEQQDLDGKVDWNPARWLNHSCCPNSEAVVEEEHIWVVALRDIKAGEEITFNYGFDLADYKDYPCVCGSSECVGYMVAEEFFEHVRRQQAVAREAEQGPVS
jgi:uncharacterized protein